MATPSETVPELIVAALVASLSQIDAAAEPTAFWYTPSQVLRVEDLDPRYLRPQDDLVYQVLEGDDYPKEDASGAIEGEMDVFIMAAKRWAPVPMKAPDPYAPYTAGNPGPWTIRNRLVQDLKTRIWRDVYSSTGICAIQVGGSVVCEGADLKDVNKRLRIEQGSYWVAVELRIAFRYTHRFDGV